MREGAAEGSGALEPLQAWRTVVQDGTERTTKEREKAATCDSSVSNGSSDGMIGKAGGTSIRRLENRARPRPSAKDQRGGGGGPSRRPRRSEKSDIRVH